MTVIHALKIANISFVRRGKPSGYTGVYGRSSSAALDNDGDKLMYRQRLYKVTWSLQNLIAPGLKYSQEIYEELLNEYCPNTSSWLDLGCGHHLLPTWRLEHEKELTAKPRLMVGIDYDYPSLTKHKTITNRLQGDISQLPFADGSFDLITSNMVFEHLNSPEDQLKEIGRVLAPGGILIFHTPNKIGYGTLMARMIPEVIKDKLVYLLEERKEEDVFPAFYRINSPKEIRFLARRAGLAVRKLRLICSSTYFTVFPPAALFELMLIRFLLSKAGKPFRPNLIAVLEKGYT